MPYFMEIGRIQDGEHLQKELDGMMSREQILLLRGPLIVPGTVLGLINEGAQTVVGSDGAGMVGNSTFTVGPTADADAAPGNYRGLFLDADTIQLNGPGGFEAIVQLGDAYNGPVNFTRTAGVTPHAAGDFFNIAVSYAAKNLWAPLDLAGVDGREVAAGVLYAGRAALTTADTRRAVAHVRNCDFNGKKLFWPAGITENQRKAQEANLAKTFMLVRY